MLREEGILRRVPVPFWVFADPYETLGKTKCEETNAATKRLFVPTFKVAKASSKTVSDPCEETELT